MYTHKCTYAILEDSLEIILSSATRIRRRVVHIKHSSHSLAVVVVKAIHMIEQQYDPDSFPEQESMSVSVSCNFDT